MASESSNPLGQQQRSLQPPNVNYRFFRHPTSPPVRPRPAQGIPTPGIEAVPAGHRVQLQVAEGLFSGAADSARSAVVHRLLQLGCERSSIVTWVIGQRASNLILIPKYTACEGEKMN